MSVPFVVVGLGQLGQEFVGKLGCAGYDLPHIDITNPESLKLIAALKPEVIINCAAYTDVDGAEREPGKAWAVNTVGPGNLADIAKRSGATLVHYSTDQVFSGVGKHPFAVDTPLCPVNVYADSKADGEERVIRSGANYLIIRTSWLYGGAGHNFVLRILEDARNKPNLIGVTDQISVPTYTKDLVEGTLAMLKAGASGIYHLTNLGKASKFEFIQEIVRAAGLTTEVRPGLTSDFPPSDAKRPEFSVLSLILTRPFYRPRPWQEALAEYINTLK
jgi:dTDP-4-dehydrorhamnose reductase